MGLFPLWGRLRSEGEPQRKTDVFILGGCGSGILHPTELYTTRHYVQTKQIFEPPGWMASQFLEQVHVHFFWYGGW